MCVNVSLFVCLFAYSYHNSSCCKVEESYRQRESAIKSCIGQVASNVDHLRQLKQMNSDDVDIVKKLRKEQTKVSNSVTCVLPV